MQFVAYDVKWNWLDNKEVRMSVHDEPKICSWQQIESILNKLSEDRTDAEIRSVLPWFRESGTIFHAFDHEGLSGIVRSADLICLKAGHVVVHQGDTGNCFYLIVRGNVVVHAKKMKESTETGNTGPVLRNVTTAKGAKEKARFGQELGTLKAGRCFGELNVLGNNKERNATVITNENCVLVCINRDACLEYISEQIAADIVQRSFFVATHSLFRTWAPSYRHLLEENFRIRHLKYGEKIVKQGEYLEVVYFIMEGQATLRMNPIQHQQKYSKLLSTVGKPSLEEGQFVPFQQLSVIDRRRLRREEGYYASEQRYHELNICTVVAGGIIGDIETILDLPYYTVTAECTQELKLYEIDKLSFLRIIVKKNPETFEKMRRSVHETIRYRNGKINGGIPLYTALLEYFQQAKPKDNRQKILQKYLEKNARRSSVSQNYFNEMSQGRTTNQVSSRKQAKGDKKRESQDVIEENTEANEPNPKSKISLWKNTGAFAGKMTVIHKKMKQQTKESESPKQFTAEEYKDLKKKLQALGKSWTKGCK